jgi:phosphonate transport system ATP-binding protein
VRRRPAGDPLFLLDGAGKRYGGTEALAPLSLAIAPGEKVALMGPSGGGKSTLLRLLAATDRPSCGRVLLAGTPTERLRPGKELARLVGVMPQGFDLVPSLAVVHNVLAGRLGEWGLLRSAVSLVAPREVERASAALRRVGIEEKLWERASRLSGGEQQRVALARLLVQRPRAILADEPVSAVDPARAEDLLAMLSGIVGESGQTLVASMHAVPLALRFFDRVVALRRGRLLFDLPATAVDPSRLDALYALAPEGSDR